MGETIEIRVIGMPGPQGSKKLVGRDGKGRGILVESSKKVKPWREAVKWAAHEYFLRDHPGDETTLYGPVSVEMIFTWPKPASAPKRRVTFPDRNPDIDKLCRSTLDALTQSGVIEDDARVIRLVASKVYPNEGKDALPVPGAVIRITGVIA